MGEGQLPAWVVCVCVPYLVCHAVTAVLFFLRPRVATLPARLPRLHASAAGPRLVLLLRLPRVVISCYSLIMTALLLRGVVGAGVGVGGRGWGAVHAERQGGLNALPGLP